MEQTVAKLRSHLPMVSSKTQNCSLLLGDICRTNCAQSFIPILGNTTMNYKTLGMETLTVMINWDFLI